MEDLEKLRALAARQARQLELAMDTLNEYVSREVDSGNLRGGIAQTTVWMIEEIDDEEE